MISGLTKDMICSRRKPDQREVLLGVDTGGHDSERPRVAWSSTNVLRVAFDIQAYLKVVARHAVGVDVDLHFDPDD